MPEKVKKLTYKQLQEENQLLHKNIDELARNKHNSEISVRPMNDREIQQSTNSNVLREVHRIATVTGDISVEAINKLIVVMGAKI